MTSKNTTERPSKRQRTEASAVSKDEVVAWATHALGYMMKAAGASPNDIVASIKAASALYQAHKTWRQMTNDAAAKIGLHAGKTIVIGMKINADNTRENVMLVTNDLIKMLKEIADARGITYQKGSDFWAISTPIVASLHYFKYRLEEVRLGTLSTKNKVSMLAKGFDAAHGILFEGIRCPPPLRGSLSSNMGPLTQLICLAEPGQAKEDKDYRDKWEAALLDSLAHLPFTSALIDQVKKQGQNAMRAVKATGDLLLLVGSRQNTRVVLPPCVLTMQLDRNQWNLIGTKAVKIAGIPPLTLTGKKAVLSYQNLGPVSFYDLTGAEQQVLFHCVFGTYRTNLGLLRWMTESPAPWLRRDQIVGLRKLSSEATMKSFTPIKLRYYSKPSSANQSEFFRNADLQVTSHPCFSGRYTQKHDKIVEYINRVTQESSIVVETGVGLVSTINRYIELVKKEFRSKPNTNWGNSEWVDMTSTPENPVYVVPNMVFEEEFFLSPASEVSGQLSLSKPGHPRARPAVQDDDSMHVEEASGSSSGRQ